MDDDLVGTPFFYLRIPLLTKNCFSPKSVKREQKISVFYSVMYMFCSMAKERKSYPQ